MGVKLMISIQSWSRGLKTMELTASLWNCMTSVSKCTLYHFEVFRRYKGLNVLFHSLVLGQNHVKTPEECTKDTATLWGNYFFSFVVGISCGIALCDLSHFRSLFTQWSNNDSQNVLIDHCWFFSFLLSSLSHALCNTDFCVSLEMITHSYQHNT